MSSRTMARYSTHYRISLVGIFSVVSECADGQMGGVSGYLVVRVSGEPIGIISQLGDI